MAAASGSQSISRRERLEHIKQREDLKGHLILKYRDRFGGGASKREADQVSVGTAAITNEVNVLVDSSAPVTQANLSRLERRIQRRADVKIADETEARPPSAISSYTVGSVALSSGSRRRGSFTARCASNTKPAKLKVSPLGCLSARSAINGPTSIGDAAYEAPKSDACIQNGQASLDWSVLDKLAAQLQKHDVELQKNVQSELQQKLKRDLEKQMEEGKLKVEREKEQGMRDLATVSASVKQWKEDEIAKKRSRDEKIAEEREKVMEQINFNQKRRDDEKLKDKQEAEEITRLAENQLVSDRVKAEETLRRRQMQLQDALTQSSNSQKLRDEREQQAIERERNSTEQYQRLREMRDKEAREQSAQEQQKREQIAVAQATQANTAKLRGQEAEAKSAEERAEMNTLAAEKETAKLDDLATQRQDTQDFLRQQMHQKQAAKRISEQERARIRVSQDADSINFQASEAQKRAEKRQQLLQHSRDLELQAAAKMPLIVGRDAISDREVRMNKQLLDSVTHALSHV